LANHDLGGGYAQRLNAAVVARSDGANWMPPQARLTYIGFDEDAVTHEDPLVAASVDDEIPRDGSTNCLQWAANASPHELHDGIRVVTTFRCCTGSLAIPRCRFGPRQHSAQGRPMVSPYLYENLN
jgi:hypothetical protein